MFSFLFTSEGTNSAWTRRGRLLQFEFNQISIILQFFNLQSCIIILFHFKRIHGRKNTKEKQLKMSQSLIKLGSIE